MVNELHGLSFHRQKVLHFLIPFWTLFAKTQNPSMPDPGCEEFMVPSLDYFMDSNWDKLLLCPIRALKRCLFCMEQFHPDILGSFIPFSRKKKQAPWNTTSFWLWSVIHHACVSTSEEDYRALWLKVHEVQKVAMSLLFKRNWSVHQVLKAGTWSSQCIFLPPTFEMSPTGIWTPSSGLWWWLSRSCNSLALTTPS